MAHLLSLHPRGPPLQVHVGVPSFAAERMTRDTSPCWSAPSQPAIMILRGSLSRLKVFPWLPPFLRCHPL
ncbi:hypothetical protein VPH35_007756 [Triticum aestivum]